jgi:hypothetical protein
MKKFRSDTYTTGVCDTVDHNRNKRFFLFEIDNHDKKLIDEILDIYIENNIDVCYHHTGKGVHFLSPTMITLDEWKFLHKKLEHINPKCPMNCLRIEPGKWNGENQYWNNTSYIKTSPNPRKNNVKSMCDLLVLHFDVEFESHLQGGIQIVRYPLPTKITCNNCNEIMDKIKQREHICGTR